MIFFYGVKARDLERILSYQRQWKGISSARHLKALIMSERGWFLLATIVLLDIVVAIAAILEFGVVKMERQPPD